MPKINDFLKTPMQEEDMRFLILFGLMIGTSFSSDNIEEFKKKAEQGDAVAQYNLGNAYDNGYGVKKNPVTNTFC